MPSLPDELWYDRRYRRLRKANLGCYVLLAAHACSQGVPVVDRQMLGPLGVTKRRRAELLSVGLVNEHPDGLELSEWDELYTLTRARKKERERKERSRAKRRALEAEKFIHAAIARDASRGSRAPNNAGSA